MPFATLGKLQKGVASSLEFSWYDCRGGLNVKKLPQQLADNELSIAYNGYLRFDGGFQMRNGMTTRGNALADSGTLQGLDRFFQEVVNGETVSPITTALIGQVGDELYNVDTGDSIGSLSADSGPMSSVNAIDPNDPYYAIDAPSAPTLSGATGASNGTEVEVGVTYVNPTGETTLSAVSDFTPSTIDAPSAPTLSTVSGTSPGTEIEVVVTYVNLGGETTPSSGSTETPSSSEQVEVASPSAETNAQWYNIYAGPSGGPYYLQNTEPVNLGDAYILPGTLVTNTATPPSSNTAGEGTGVASPSDEGNATGYNVYAGQVGGPYYLQNASPVALGTAYVLPAVLSTDTANPPSQNTTQNGQTDVLVLCTGAGGPYVYDGMHLYTPAGWSAASGASWCALVNGILWFGGIPATPNTIYGSGDGILESFETLPGYRVFVMSQPVTGLCALGTGATAALVIGMNTGISVLSGTSPSTFYLADIPSDDGVMAGRTMVYDNGTVYWLGRQAVYAFNGNGPPVPLSLQVEPFVLNDLYIQGYPMNGTRATSFAFVYNNRLHIVYESSATYCNTLLVYDLIVQGWTVLQVPMGMASACLLDAPGDASPAVCIVGSGTTAQAYTWDVVPSIGDPAMDNGTNIACQVQTKFFKVGVPGTNKALQRCYPEFYLSGPFSASWTVATDYGSETYSSILVINPDIGSAEWDVAEWDDALWAGTSAFVSYNAPESRLDFGGIQAEAFAFGVQTANACSPWAFAGASGVWNQRGRT